MSNEQTTNLAAYPSSQTVQRQVLPNGITVLVYERFASQSIAIEGLLRTGALAETAAAAGLSSLTAAALMRGTHKRSFEQIYDGLESVGGNIGFSSGYHTTSFSAHGLVEDTDLFLDLLSEALREPVFPEAQVAQVRGQMLTVLQMERDDTQRMANLLFDELVYPNHPYGRSELGTPETIRPLTAADLRAFHAQNYGPQGLIITLVGALKAETAVAKVVNVLGDWANPAQKPVTAVADMPRPETILRRHHVMPDKQQADIRLGLPGPRRSAPDYLDASLMNTILGVFGMMGRIGQRVREEQGLAYYAYSSLQGGLGPAPWSASAGVAPAAVDQAIDSILAEITRIQNELVSPEELADSQAYRIGSMPMDLETNRGLAGVMTDLETYELGLDYLLHFPEQIRAITPERIQAAAQKYLSTTQLGIAIAGPTAESADDE